MLWLYLLIWPKHVEGKTCFHLAFSRNILFALQNVGAEIDLITFFNSFTNGTFYLIRWRKNFYLNSLAKTRN